MTLIVEQFIGGKGYVRRIDKTRQGSRGQDKSKEEEERERGERSEEINVCQGYILSDRTVNLLIYSWSLRLTLSQVM